LIYEIGKSEEDMKKTFIFLVALVFLSFNLKLLANSSSQDETSTTKSFDIKSLVSSRDNPVISPRFFDFLKNQKPNQKVKIWVFFTDKGIFSEEKYRQIEKTALSSLTSQALNRRTKVLPGKVDFKDFEVCPSYIREIQSLGARLRHTSRWLNAASFEVTISQVEKIASLAWVRSIRPVLAYKRKLEPVENALPLGKIITKPFDLDYGISYEQLQQINLPAVHNLGYKGQGILVCMMDTGFRKDHQAFRKAFEEGRVWAEHDFINNDSNTQNEAGDPAGQHNHGTYTWSTLGGAYDGELYGPAYMANFILAKTENTASETPIEEDNWVAGMEWADSIGAEVISSSLGYIDWYSYPDLDGNTAVTTIAADIAAQRGIVVCNAMGNEGPAPGSLIAPADADSIVACGAVRSDGVLASFSSRGPTYDGRIKPEVLARGVSTYCAIASDTNLYGYVSGTSLSTPLIGGCAAVLLSAHPDWTPMKVREALMMTADNASNPNNDRGWGIVDLLAALNYSFQTGDVNRDQDINLADAIYLANYLMKNGPTPQLLYEADVNCDSKYNLSDVIYLARYVLSGGLAPCVY
jgi:serine protease AprX